MLVKLLGRIALFGAVALQGAVLTRFFPNVVTRVDPPAVLTRTEHETLATALKSKLRALGIVGAVLRQRADQAQLTLPEASVHADLDLKKKVLTAWMPFKETPDAISFSSQGLLLTPQGQLEGATLYQGHFPPKEQLEEFASALFEPNFFYVEKWQNEFKWHPYWDLITEDRWQASHVHLTRPDWQLKVDEASGKYMFSFLGEIPVIEQKAGFQGITFGGKGIKAGVSTLTEKARFHGLAPVLHNAWLLASSGKIEIGAQNTELELPFYPRQITLTHLNGTVEFKGEEAEIHLSFTCAEDATRKGFIPEKGKMTLKAKKLNREILSERLLSQSLTLNVLRDADWDVKGILENEQAVIEMHFVGQIEEDKPVGDVEFLIRNFDVISPPAKPVDEEQCALMQTYLQNVAVQTTPKEKEFLQNSACQPTEDAGLLKDLRPFLQEDKRIFDEKNHSVDIIKMKLTPEGLKNKND